MYNENGRKLPNVNLLSGVLLTFAERARPSAHQLGSRIQLETFLKRTSTISQLNRLSTNSKQPDPFYYISSDGFDLNGKLFELEISCYKKI